MSQLFTSGGQRIRVSASVLPVNIRAWFPLQLTVFIWFYFILFISFLSKGLWIVFSSTTAQKHQFFGVQASLGFSGGGMLCLVTQPCPTLSTPWTVAHQAPLSMVILRAKILEWIARPSSIGSSQLRDQTQVSNNAGRFLTIWATKEAQVSLR